MALRPIVANRVRKDVTMGVEATLGNRLFQSLRRFEFGARILVPETERSIGANGGQSAMNWMECNVVDSINVLNVVVRRDAMAFKGEVVLRIDRVDLKRAIERRLELVTVQRKCVALSLRYSFAYILNRDSTLNTAERVSAGALLLVPENRDRSMLVFEGALRSLVFSRLVFQ